ncbi:hypothetical protein [Burkholderia sp. PU8-34]
MIGFLLMTSIGLPDQVSVPFAMRKAADERAQRESTRERDPSPVMRRGDDSGHLRTMRWEKRRYGSSDATSSVWIATNARAETALWRRTERRDRIV